MKLKPRLMWLIISILYIGGIFMLSLKPIVGGNRSLVIEIINNLLHIPLYGGLAFFLMLALRHFLSGIYPYIYTVIFGMGVASMDEFMQSFVPGRIVSKIDLLLDLIGICFVIILLNVLKLNKIKMKAGGKIDVS